MLYVQIQGLGRPAWWSLLSGLGVYFSQDAESGTVDLSMLVMS